jgi:hypothetical protein
MQLGVQHSLSTNFKLFKYFSASTSLNYEEVDAKHWLVVSVVVFEAPYYF